MADTSVLTLTLNSGDKTKSISVPANLGNVLFEKLSNNPNIKHLDLNSFESLLNYCISRSVVSSDLPEEEIDEQIMELISSKVKTQSNGDSQVTMTTSCLEANNIHMTNLIDEMSKNGLSMVETSVTTDKKSTKSVSKFKLTRYPREYDSGKVIYPQSMTTQTDGFRTYLVISDIHAPYHDEKLVWNLVRFGITNKFFGCIINGDILDLPYFGSYDKKLEFYDMESHKRTINEMGRLCDVIGENFEYKLLIDGNHDQRMSRNALGNKVSGEGIKPYGSDCDLFSVGTYLGLQRHTGEEAYKNFLVMPYGSSTQIGNPLDGVAVHHGDKFGKNINPDMIKANNLYGHTHRLETKIGCRLTDSGEMVSVAEYRTGCLLDFSKEIPCMSSSIKDNWNHGFAIITEDVKTGQCFVDNILINNGKFLYKGEVIDLYDGNR